ncbi:OmpL47-type beta-barrel domain-containing protein [Paenibacillus sp. HJGM_3]|uniref:OmpL47-type beta-barrel domain-containing protein n=1 Tax=Paenibacillus sp. HJGM_3 TaxID=3379816 RepID=UPI00385E6912
MRVRLVSLVLTLSLFASLLGLNRHASADAGNANVKDLGTMFPGSILVMTSSFGKEKGSNVLYTVVAGAPAIFATYNIDSGKVIRQLPLDEAAGSWSLVTDKNGNVYIGTYAYGYSYKFDPSTETLTNIGKIPGETYGYSLVEGKDGKIYGGTYQNGKVFEYDPATNETKDLGVVVPGENYVRALAYNPDQNKLYAGIGSHAHLVEIDLATMAKKELMSPDELIDPFITELRYIDGKLFIGKKQTMVVYDTATNQVIRELPWLSRGISLKSPAGNKIYYAYLNTIYEYDLGTNVEKKLLDLGSSRVTLTPVSMEFVELNDPAWPGWTLVGLAGTSGRMFKYSIPLNKAAITYDMGLPFTDRNINAIVNAPDGRIQMGGFLSGGGITSYNPVNGAVVKTPGLGQVEGFGVLNDKVYAGVYPRAELFEYDPVTIAGSSVNELESSGQNRPYAVLGLQKENKVAMGTIASYGSVEGAMALYDVSTKQTAVYKSIVPNQSVVSLAYKNGTLYGGTTIFGGLGSVPVAKEAKLFGFEMKSGQKSFEVVPVPGATAITSLITGPDGNLWGFANGTLFIFDTETRQVVYSDPKFLYKGQAEWRNVVMTIGTDGNVYGLYNTDSAFFKLDAVTKQMSILDNDARTGLAQDDFGNFYFIRGTHLIQYSDPSLQAGFTNQLLLSTASNPALKPGGSIKLTLAAQLEKGRTTRNLTGAAIQYFTSNPAVATVDAKGLVNAVGEGSAEVWATAVLANGISAVSQKLTLVVDRTPPVTQAAVSPATGKNGWYVSDGMVTLSVEDNLSGAASTQYRLNGSAWTPYSQPVAVSQEGANVMEYMSVDKAGNEEAVQSLTLNVDKTLPVIQIAGASTYTVDQNVMITCTASDTVSGVTYSSCASPLVDTPAYKLTPGTHTVTAQAEDAAGHVSTVTAEYTVSATQMSLINLIRQWVTGPGAEGVQNSLITKLTHGQLDAFQNEVLAQKGKHLVEEYADALITWVKALK